MMKRITGVKGNKMGRKSSKRILAAILAAALVMGSLAGCGAASETKTDSTAAEEDYPAAEDYSDTEEYPSSEEYEAEASEEYSYDDSEGEVEGSYESSVAEDSTAEDSTAENTEAQKNAMSGGTTDDLAYPSQESESLYNGEEFYPGEEYGDVYSEEYDKAEENGFCLTMAEPLSTFSADVDTASYANVRRMIEEGYGAEYIEPDAVRAEEFINYFSYDLKLPKKGDLFGVTTEMSTCPWNENHKLMLVGMKTQDIDLSHAPANNLVFLLDVSGSMDEADKLPLLQNSFKKLVKELDEKDRVSIVTYASGVNTVLSGVSGEQKEEINDAIDSLYAGGGTNGEDGIQRAYKLAEANYIKGGNNRVILATDGDLNIGISEPDELEKFISKKKDKGVFLSVLGFGTGNIKDNNMEALADNGNGNYSYIDSLFEAKKVLVEEMGATLLTVAKDVKLQVEFNPDLINSYRLIGYENRMLSNSDFNDDTRDAGEIGAGHSVIALYEIIPAGSRDEIPLKYQGGKAAASEKDAYADEYATVGIRYKKPKSDTSELISYVVDKEDETKYPSDDFTFASMVAEFAMLLSDSPNKGTSTYEGIMDTYKTLDIDDEYKEEFYYLVKQMAKR